MVSMFNTRETELTLLGMAMDNRLVANEISTLPDDTMFDDDTAAIHMAIKKIVSSGGAAEFVTLTTELEERFIPTAIDAAQRGITSVGYKQLITTLLDRRTRHRVQKACLKAVSDAGDTNKDIQSIIQDCQTGIQEDVKDDDSVGMQDAVLQVMEDIDNAGEGRCMTGISGLDSMTGGLKGGKLVYIGARPGVGKTALSLFIATHVAQTSGRVLFSSLEMTPSELATRIISAYSGIDTQAIESGRLPNEQAYLKLTEAYSLVSTLNMKITNKASTPLILRRIASGMKSEKEGLAMIVVDYVQLMKAGGKSKGRYEEVTDVSRELKLLAMDLNVPIIVLTQFNRNSETSQYGKVVKRKPSMSESKDSGAIEQDANIFITQYAPECPENSASWGYHCFKTASEHGEEWQILDIEKNRQGRKGAIDVAFDKAHMRFRTLINDTGRW